MLSLHPEYDRVVCAGDSLSVFGGVQWAISTGGFADQVNAATISVPRGARLSGRPGRIAAGRAGRNRTPARALNVQMTGIGGQRIADILTNIAAQVTTPKPTVLILDCAVNDSTDIHNSTQTVNGYLTTLGQVTDGVLSALPTCKIAITSTWARGENWGVVNGAPGFNNFGTNVTDDAQAAINAGIQTFCSQRGFEFIDFRAGLAAAEGVANAPAPGAHDGVYCLVEGGNLGLHPNAAGCVLMGTFAIGHFTVS